MLVGGKILALDVAARVFILTYDVSLAVDPTSTSVLPALRSLKNLVYTRREAYISYSQAVLLLSFTLYGKRGRSPVLRSSDSEYIEQKYLKNEDIKTNILKSNLIKDYVAMFFSKS